LLIDFNILSLLLNNLDAYHMRSIWF